MSGERRERRLADAGVVREARIAWLHVWWFVRDAGGWVTPGDDGVMERARRAFVDRRAAQDVADVVAVTGCPVLRYPAPGSLP